MTPEIALAASAREWPDRLHRFLLDHGGGVVVLIPSHALEASEVDAGAVAQVHRELELRLDSELRSFAAEDPGSDPSQLMASTA